MSFLANSGACTTAGIGFWSLRVCRWETPWLCDPGCSRRSFGVRGAGSCQGHARRSLRLRICPSRRRVKGLSVSDARPAGGVTRGDVGSDAPVDLEDSLLEAREGPALDGEEQNEPSSKTADGRQVAKEAPSGVGQRSFVSCSNLSARQEAHRLDSMEGGIALRTQTERRRPTLPWHQAWCRCSIVSSTTRRCWPLGGR
jgi:hypothetical protein